MKYRPELKIKWTELDLVTLVDKERFSRYLYKDKLFLSSCTYKMSSIRHGMWITDSEKHVT